MYEISKNNIEPEITIRLKFNLKNDLKLKNQINLYVFKP